MPKPPIHKGSARLPVLGKTGRFDYHIDGKTCVVHAGPGTYISVLPTGPNADGSRKVPTHTRDAISGALQAKHKDHEVRFDFQRKGPTLW